MRDDAAAPVTAKVPAWTSRQLAPTGLVAEAGPGFVVLAWDAPAGDVDAVDGYEILRRRVNRGERVLLTLVADTGTADTSYVDRSANEEGVKYAYRVKARRGATASVWSMFTNAVGQANSVEFVEGPEPELETGEQHDDATEYSDRAVFGLDFDFDCNRSYPYQGFRLLDESLTGYDSAPYFEDNNPYIKKAADADGEQPPRRRKPLPPRLRSLPILPHTASQRKPFPKTFAPIGGNRYIVNWEGDKAPVTIEGVALHSVNPALTAFQGANDAAIRSPERRPKRQYPSETDPRPATPSTATACSWFGSTVVCTSDSGIRTTCRISPGSTGSNACYQEQYEHIDESDWPEVPGVRYYVDDYGVRGGWQYHHIGIPSCGTKYFRVAALYSNYT